MNNSKQTLTSRNKNENHLLVQDGSMQSVRIAVRINSKLTYRSCKRIQFLINYVKTRSSEVYAKCIQLDKTSTRVFCKTINKSN